MRYSIFCCVTLFKLCPVSSVDEQLKTIDGCMWTARDVSRPSRQQKWTRGNVKIPRSAGLKSLGVLVGSSGSECGNVEIPGSAGVLKSPGVLIVGSSYSLLRWR
ncbi:uncharacterized protein [Rhodnius prolixus]|uniref:uncharacterized protein n=1 Tax=Rhodnius prolixus TaxID=13249 RepID=UPI003D189853